MPGRPPLVTAMAKKHVEEEHGESAPLWIVSFADLVTLMLSFFVILSCGNNKETSTADPEFAAVVAAVQAAFKNVPPVDAADPKADFNELVKKIMAMASKKEGAGAANKGDSKDQGIHGKSFRVRRLRDGMEITIGGPVMFEPFAAKPTTEGEQQLRDVINLIKGHRNIIEIRGHAGDEPWPADWTYSDTMKLSYQRAEFVSAQLVAQGTDPRTIRLMAVGPNEPVAKEVYNKESRGDNRRVEIIVRESLIDDYVGQTSTNGPATQPARAAHD
jgi:chemotaxis protein MotB